MTDDRIPGRQRTGGAGLRLAAVGWILYWAARAPDAGQWDSFDYLKQIVTHHPSDLGFGRPIFLGYNIALWEATKKALGLETPAVASVAVAATVVLGGLGVFLFHRAARRLLGPRGAALAALSLLLSPVYALYSGYVMTEVPMLVALLGAVVVLLEGERRSEPARELAAGVLFGLSVGIREQAVVWVGAFLWLFWVLRPDARARLGAIARFGAAAAAMALVPVVALAFGDPARFAARLETWLRVIPTEEAQFARNLQASLLYLFATAPAAWLALAGGAAWRLVSRLRRAPHAAPAVPPVPHSGWGALCCLALPVASLWRDADVQIHPRYLLVALPAALVLCARLYRRWFPSDEAAAVWAVLHLALFGVAQVPIQLIRQVQVERKAYVRMVSERIPSEALIVAGGYSPMLDYYRIVGNRPGWTILWSGWEWSREKARATIEDALARGRPVYICDGPYAWLNFELERLDVYQIVQGREADRVAPGLTLIR